MDRAAIVADQGSKWERISTRIVGFLPIAREAVELRFIFFPSGAEAQHLVQEDAAAQPPPWHSLDTNNPLSSSTVVGCRAKRPSMMKTMQLVR